MDKEYEMLRAQLWKEVYVAYVNASNSRYSSGGASWADTALEAFDQRFKTIFQSPTPLPRP